eukprot:4379547-Pyramimonas_sp.AAC.3
MLHQLAILRERSSSPRRLPSVFTSLSFLTQRTPSVLHYQVVCLRTDTESRDAELLSTRRFRTARLLGGLCNCSRMRTQTTQAQAQAQARRATVAVYRLSFYS